jgi:hypothetical protein
MAELILSTRVMLWGGGGGSLAGTGFQFFRLLVFWRQVEVISNSKVPLDSLRE